MGYRSGILQNTPEFDRFEPSGPIYHRRERVKLSFPREIHTHADNSGRARPAGKFFHLNGKRVLIKGVTYGTFAPDSDGRQFPALDEVAADFAHMAEYGINTVRVYTPPSIDMLDEAARHGLRVMIGTPWPQHVAFLDDRHLRATIRRDIASTVRSFADHPAVLLYALGNEIPAAVVRWHGRERTEQFIREVYEDAKSAAPDSAFTYVNFPPTEFLELPFLDVCAFNVYLHDEVQLRRYVARLQHIAGHKPLLLAEAGADSFRHGLDEQGRLTAMQLRASFAEGACGAIAFAWTDEWWRGGHPIEDWAFGLVDRERRPKPALRAVAKAFADAPFSAYEQRQWPKVSVVICAYNAASTLDDCLSSLGRLTYPDVEILVVNDGSKDATGEIARRYPFVNLIEVSNGGLSLARNIGAAHATGEIVAYTDADVRVESDWLTYLVQPFLNSDVVACGGPNVVPLDDSWLARAVALSPGGPTHVLLDDRIAEHVPGCNIAFRREALLAIGGFNPIYLRAGDDVDVCWRLQARGGQIGFSPAALVWHHHRPSIKAYWRQQLGYGEGEAWLEPHHPDKFVAGRAVWHGRIYSPLPFVRSLVGKRIDAGVWGTAAFPSVYHPGANPLTLLPHSAAWVETSLALVLAGGLTHLASSTLAATMLPLLASLMGLTGLFLSIARCVRCARQTDARVLPQIPGWSPAVSRVAVRATIAWLHFIQPIARQTGWMRGRMSAAAPESDAAPANATPALNATREDRNAAVRLMTGGAVDARFWGEAWTTGEIVLTHLVKRLRALRVSRHIDVDDGWQLDRDVSVNIGKWGWLDLRSLVEDHGAGQRLLRMGQRLRISPLGTIAVIAAILAIPVAAALDMRFGWSIFACWLAAIAGAAAGAVWQTTRVLAAVRLALHQAAEAVGMEPISESDGDSVSPPSMPTDVVPDNA